MNKKQPETSFVYNLRPIHRLLLSLATSIALFFAFSQFPMLMRLLIGWIGFSLTYNILCWIIITNAPIDLIKRKAEEEDGSKAFVFSMLILATFASMFAVLMLIISDQSAEVNNGLLITTVIGAMILSWTLVHSVFTFHYAHKYYREGDKGSGLDFPGNEPPGYFDFAYFSFVIGCTFQVSDVTISDKSIRKTVLFHGLLAFALNTFVVALTINIIAGLSK